MPFQSQAHNANYPNHSRRKWLSDVVRNDCSINFHLSKLSTCMEKHGKILENIEKPGILPVPIHEIGVSWDHYYQRVWVISNELEWVKFWLASRCYHTHEGYCNLHGFYCNLKSSLCLIVSLRRKKGIWKEIWRKQRKRKLLLARYSVEHNYCNSLL